MNQIFDNDGGECSMSIHRSIFFTLQTKMFTQKKFSLTSCVWVPPCYMVGGTRDGTMYRWTIPEKLEDSTLYPLNSIKKHDGNISFLHWSESMQLLFSGCSDRSVLVWQMNNRTFPSEPLLSIRCFESTPLCIETYTKFLFVVEKRGITILSLGNAKNQIETKQMFKKVTFLTLKNMRGNGYNTICFSPNSTVDNSGYLYAGFENGTILQYDAQLTDNPQFVTAGYAKKVSEFAIFKLTYVPRENLIFVFTYDRHLRIYNPRNNRIINILQNPHNEDFLSACYEDATQQYLLGDRNGHLYIYEFQEMARILYQTQFNTHCDNLITASSGKFLFMQREGVSMIDINRGTVKQSYKIHNGTIFYITLIDDGTSKMIATVGEDKFVRVIDPLSFTPKQPHKIPTNVVVLSAYVGVRERPKNPMIWSVTGHDFGKIFFMNLSDDKHVELPSKHKNSISSISVVMSEMKVIMLSCDYDGYVSTWSIDSILDNFSYAAVSMIKIWKASDKEILASSGQWIDSTPIFATGGNDKLIHIWHESDSNYTETLLQGHTDSVTVLLFEGFFLFSGSEDLTIRIWDIVNNVQLLMIQRLHKFAIRSISHIDGESKFTSSDAGGEVVVYDYIKRKVLWSIKHSSDCKCVYADKQSNRVFACVKSELIPHSLNNAVMNSGLPSLMSMSVLSSRY
ncbi:hypothetical protein TRFO_06610 [Tritrichomonas foetus]|uniref:WD repeat protein n=1 Tax=Tritrichomonas foetus TaxID=1144522 RepID=A0A1J4JYJ2_9EUKA|nr:hypothetical protein TRFO_06610 [Tritrichomonas foetus]|eukprot:OHT03762.1 hypothetical protein TRFO_06610 [Tritrichomonas foetus]